MKRIYNFKIFSKVIEVSKYVMIHNIIYGLFVFLLCFNNNAVAQNSKKIEKEKIVSRTCWETDFETGDKEYISEVKYFNQQGKLIKEIEYDVTGEVRSRKEYEYNADNRLLVEKNFDDKNKLTKHIEYQYDGKLLIAETYYGTKGDIKKIIKYTYENKLKTEKLELDSKGRPKNKKRYSYKTN